MRTNEPSAGPAKRKIHIFCTVIAVFSVLLGVWGIHVSTHRGYLLAACAGLALIGVAVVLAVEQARSDR